MKISDQYSTGLVVSLLLLFLLSCQKEELETTFVDKELQSYFDRFQSEGILRGNMIDFNLITVEGYLSKTLEPSISGQCQHDPNHPDRVLINQSYWDNADSMEREFLVFHELGHCYLQRQHLDTRDSRGVCVSMMHSGASVCRNNYSSQTRTNYLDELFNPN